MLSEKIKFKDADFAGIKLIMDGVSIQQVSDIQTAITRAIALDDQATEFEYLKSDGSVEIVKK